MHGRLDILQWARSNGCPWNTCVVEFAARRNDLDVLLWALDDTDPAPFPARGERPRAQGPWRGGFFGGDDELQAESAEVMALICGWRLTETEVVKVSKLWERQVTLLLCLRKRDVPDEVSAIIGRRAGMPWLVKGKV